MELSLRKYLSMALKWLIPFALLESFILLLYFTKIADLDLFVIINLANFICLLLPGTYFLMMFFFLKKKCKNFTPKEGVISNWKSGFYRYTGGVTIHVDSKEYSTAAYFSHEECKALVGKSVSYAIIGETLFIYEMKE